MEEENLGITMVESKERSHKYDPSLLIILYVLFPTL
jgi:hypothetical protein